MHILRYTFASILIDSGESIRTVSEYLGHKDPGFTLRVYGHLMPKASERTRKAVHEALWGDSVNGLSSVTAPQVHPGETA